MSFPLSKILWALVAPSNLLLLLLIAGMMSLASGRHRLGRGLLASAILVLLAVATLPVGDWLLWRLEHRFPVSTRLPSQVDGIIVLGGAVSPVLTSDHGQPALNRHAERLTELPALAARYPGARLVFTGGSGLLLEQDLKEAPVARAAWERMGFTAERVIYESESRNTWENALFTRDLVKPLPGEIWLLVTSAAHMPRSMGIFHRIGWPVIAYPVDFQVARRDLGRLRFDLATGLDILDDTVREYVGLIAYHALDRTDRLFPRADP